MEKIGFIEIKVTGAKGNLELSTDNYDIREVITILEHAENLLFPKDKKDRPIISYRIEAGSVRHLFKTSVQYIIGFNAVLGQIAQSKNIDFLDLPTANAIHSIQEIASKKEYAFAISTSIDQSNELKIDKTTNFYRSESVWADAEFYLYGKVTNAGGKEKANIHIHTEDLGTIRVETPIAFLEEYEENMLYKAFGIRAVGKQNSETGEIDKTSLKFIELIDYHQSYDEEYLKSLREKAKKSWFGNLDANKWLREMRGGYDA